MTVKWSSFDEKKFINWIELAVGVSEKTDNYHKDFVIIKDLKDKKKVKKKILLSLTIKEFKRSRF